MGITYRLMTPKDARPVSQMVITVFEKFVGPDFSPMGRAEFIQYAQPNAIAQRIQLNHFAILAIAAHRDIVGLIEARNLSHLSWLFVAEAFQGQGIARILFEKLLAELRDRNPNLSVLTVHASRYALPIYEKFGFKATAQEQNYQGIIYTPMERPLNSPDRHS